MEFKIRAFGIGVVAAFSVACSGGSEGSHSGGVNAGGFGATPGAPGGAGGDANPLSTGGSPQIGAGGSTPFGGGGAPNAAGGSPSFGGNGAGGGEPSTGGSDNMGGQVGSGGEGNQNGPAPTADSASKKGSCTVQSYTAGVAGGADYVNPTVYYPTDCPGPFPGVVVIPGFTEAQNAINQWGTFLASHGFVTMTVDTAAGGLANTVVQPPSRALGLAEGVKTLQGENTRSGSPLAGKVDTEKMAVMGHSMGGGGTMLAANAHPELKAAIGLCPWNPGVTYPQNTVPSLFFDGTADFLVPPAAATAEYQSIPTTTPKVYAEFNGGSHFVANTPLGAAPTDAVVARIGLSWLEVHMLGDTRYQQFIQKDTATMSNWDMKP